MGTSGQDAASGLPAELRHLMAKCGLPSPRTISAKILAWATNDLNMVSLPRHPTENWEGYAGVA